jgi:transcriptional regulator with XRE-family HTH domain
VGGAGTAYHENGDYLDRGPTRRRHIHAVALAHIGKEANRWEEQLYLGEDPQAQIEYGASPEAKDRLRGSVLQLSRPFTSAALARTAGLAASTVTDILAGRTNPPVATWLKLYQAANALDAARRERAEREQRTLVATRAHCQKHSTRAVAIALGLDPANLSHVLNGKRRPSRAMLTKLESMLSGRRSS